MSHSQKIISAVALIVSSLMNRSMAAQHKSPLGVDIDVVIEDAYLLKGTNITFEICQNNINTLFEGYTKTYSYPVNANHLHFHIPLSTEINYGRIHLENDSDNFEPWKRPLDESNNLFLFEKGDRVTLHLTARHASARFTGKSAVKYNGMYAISNLGEDESLIWYNHYNQLKQYEKAFEAVKLHYDSVYRARVIALNILKNRLTPKIYNLIKTDCWAIANDYILRFCYSVFIMHDTTRYAPAISFFKKTYAEYQNLPVQDRDIFILSYHLCDFLALREKVYATVKSSSATSNSYPSLRYQPINEAIDQHYPPGALKDKIRLTSFLNIDRAKEADFVDYLKQAVEGASKSLIKQALNKFKDTNQYGGEAFPLQLSDSDGQIRRLEEFKGKLIIVDFWFTGCHACLNLFKALKPIISLYKDNPNIMFITVCVDKDKQIWLNSLAEGIYATNEEVNLLGENGWKSAITQYYNISAYPTLIAISADGKNISTAVPDPRYHYAELTAFLEKNLKLRSSAKADAMPH